MKLESKRPLTGHEVWKQEEPVCFLIAVFTSIWCTQVLPMENDIVTGGRMFSHVHDRQTAVTLN